MTLNSLLLPHSLLYSPRLIQQQNIAAIISEAKIISVFYVHINRYWKSKEINTLQELQNIHHFKHG
jgi:hypothetical protein